MQESVMYFIIVTPFFSWIWVKRQLPKSINTSLNDGHILYKDVICENSSIKERGKWNFIEAEILYTSKTKLVLLQTTLL